MTLIGATELAERIAAGDGPLLLDARFNLMGPDGREEYLAGHLPGAVWVDVERDLSGPAGDGGRHPLPDSAAFVTAMRRAGVSADTEIVVCDGGSTLGAARLWWLLRDHGHHRVRVLDGGCAAWQASGGAVATGEVVVPAGDFDGTPGHMPQIGVTDVLAGDRALVDVRDAERHAGLREPIDPVAGHIPGATNLPAAGSFVDGRFRPATELVEHFASVPVGAAVYCGSGITAAQTILALEIAGRGDVALYPGSWSEWIADPQRPVMTNGSSAPDTALRWEPGDEWLVQFDLELTPTVELARQELVEFAMASCGVHIVGETAGAAAGTIRFRHEDIPGHRVDVGPAEMVFTAGTAVSLLYAVYAFAEQHLGHCFFEPGRDRCRPVGAVGWPVGTITADGAPLLRSRGFIQEYPPDARSHQLADWMARNRMNYLLTWMEYYDQYDPELKEYFAVRGVEIESGHHNFEYFVPMSEHYQDHPEYFAEIGGHRVGPSSEDQKLLLSKQICTSNPEVRALLAERLLEYAAEHPEVSTLSLVPNDGFGWCECASCTALLGDKVPGRWETISAHVYQAQRLYHSLVDDVAARVARRRPDLTISFFAYVNYLHPAQGFTLGQGLAAHVAFYWRCINHTLAEPDCPTNVAYLEALDAWAAVKRGGELNVYEYYMGVNLYLSLPMVHHDQLQDEARLIAERGGDGVLTQFHLDNWAAYGLNYYMFARGAWGEASQGAITQVLDDLFGTGAAAAESFLHALDRLQRGPDQGRVPCLVPVPRLLLGHRSRTLFTDVLCAAERLAEVCTEEPLATAWLAWARFLVGLKDAFDANAAGTPSGDRLTMLLDTVRRDEAAGLHYAVTAKVELLFSRWLRSEAEGTQWCHSGIDWEDDYILEWDARLAADRQG